jgi:hypothetical protein
MSDGREELLVPAAQQNLSAASQVIEPGFLILNVKPEGPAVASGKMIQEALDDACQHVTVFFKQIAFPKRPS